ncbi:NAD-dependent epimerase/dehydratase family protein [Niveispirillum sp. SYP-B3756]|uniref:NAD-dependent epimerase/dehydratase family protein n=1 Tax=Niveispirillum sp. SYP-B3756 TaxID=2662178 RepID=UPI0012927B7C|nr:NAD-dependent epimerase/dehydratase family protein [Niveispirillum sp. SYP-B3756]MQP67613.1 NAD-dependent epimerase/dehydratase family protein [Niveispirillum sp. SYP-B3756]
MAGDRPVVAVTGGTGFLGRHLVASLWRAGYQPRLLVRQDPAHPLLEGIHPQLVPGDLGDEKALTRLVTGAAAVIHAGGLIKAVSREAFFAVNEGGSARLGRTLARHAPQARFLVISSQAARAPTLSDYAASKRAGEDAAIAAYGGADWLVIRPPAIYGPWDRETLSLFKAAAGPVVPVLGGKAARIAMLHVSDAAAAITALVRPGVKGRCYTLCDGHHAGYGWDELLDYAAAAVGHRALRLRVPPGLLSLLGGLSGFQARLTGRPAMLTQGKVREILHPDWTVAAADMPDSGLWRPNISLAEGFHATAGWYRSRGWI